MNILLVDDKGGPYILDTIRCLSTEKEMNIFVVSPEQKPYFNTISYSKYVKKYAYITVNNDLEKVNKIKALTKEWQIDTILPIKQSNYKFFVEYKNELNGLLFPPIPTQESFEMVSDKWLLSQWMDKHSFPSPQSHQATIANLEKLSFPVLLKPCSDTRGIQVKSIRNKEEALAKLDSPDFESKDFIFQEYIRGEDIDISLLAENGNIRAYTIQKGLIREALSFATGIEFIDNDPLLKQTEAIIREMKWNGVAHLDFIYHKESDTYQLLDFNPRIWSTMIGSRYVGVNFPVLMVQIAQNKEVKYNGYKKTNYFLTQQALLNFRTELFKNRKLTSLKNSSWNYVLRDPLPEILKGLDKAFSVFKKRENKGNQMA